MAQFKRVQKCISLSLVSPVHFSRQTKVKQGTPTSSLYSCTDKLHNVGQYYSLMTNVIAPNVVVLNLFDLIKLVVTSTPSQNILKVPKMKSKAGPITTRVHKQFDFHKHILYYRKIYFKRCTVQRLYSYKQTETELFIQGIAVC